MAAALREIDVRPLAPRERGARFLEAFDRLEEGESLVLVDDHDPRALFYLLRSHRGDRLAWFPTVRGPAEWRVTVRRLRPKALEETLRGFFAREHDELHTCLDHLAADLRAAERRHAPGGGAAIDRFDEFAQRLEAHLRAEEDGLFHRVELRMPALALDEGRALRAEHEGIRQLSRVVGDHLRRDPLAPADLARASESLDLLAELLAEHHRKEEDHYYGRCEEALGAEEAREALETVKASPDFAEAAPLPPDPFFVDLRERPAEDRRVLLARAFERLEEGESFSLVSEEDPRPILDEFRRAHGGRAGLVAARRLAGEWRVEVRRHPPEDRERSLHAFLARDHEEIDAMIAFAHEDLRALRASATPPPAAVVRAVAELAERLQRHSRWEDQVLFPAVEAKIPPLARGLGHVMRMEHREIRRLLASALRSLRDAASRPASSEETANALAAILELLREHHEKEEYVHYAVADRMFGEDELAGILARLREGWAPSRT